jgi:hypothetical protein
MADPQATCGKAEGIAMALRVLPVGWAPMLKRRHHCLAALVACGFAWQLSLVACDLNPQPLPPGETFGGAEDAGPALPVANGSVDAGTGTALGGGEGGDAAATPPSGVTGDGGLPDGDAAADLDSGPDSATDSGEDAAPLDAGGGGG